MVGGKTGGGDAGAVEGGGKMVATSGEDGGGDGGEEEAGGAKRGEKGTARMEWEVAGMRMVARRRMEAWNRRLSGILHEELRWPYPWQRRQRTGSRHSSTRWSEAKQRKQVLESERGFRVLQVF